MSRYPEPSFPALFTQAVDKLRTFDRDLITVLSNWSLQMKGLLDRGLSIADNADAVYVSYTSNATPDTEDAVAHTLGRVPVAVIVAGQNKGASIYSGPTAFTKDNVYLKATAASVAVKLILH